MPPEYVLTSRPAAQPVQPALQDQVLPAGRGRVGAGALGDDADHMPHPARLGEYVDARHAGRAGVRPGQRGEDFHRGALARPVRAEQTINDAPRDTEVEPVQGPDAVLVSVYGVGLD